MERPSAPPSEEIGIGVQRLRVSVAGRGRPVLLIMGFAGSLELWAPLLAELPGHQTIAFDAPGTGDRSPRPGRSESPRSRS
ncbi:MAG: hypothetical protein R3F21_15400 [Myxococcota bacterium]